MPWACSHTHRTVLKLCEGDSGTLLIRASYAHFPWLVVMTLDARDLCSGLLQLVSMPGFAATFAPLVGTHSTRSHFEAFNRFRACRQRRARRDARQRPAVSSEADLARNRRRWFTADG